MSRGFPSMTAMLGLLAIAGYQNRDKIAEMLSGLGQKNLGTEGQGGVGGLLSQMGVGGAGATGVLSGGLAELMDRFKQSGQGQTAESWVSTGPNEPCTTAQLERAIGPEVLDTLSTHTGLSRTNYSRGFAANFPMQWISTRHRAVFRPKPTFRARK